MNCSKQVLVSLYTSIRMLWSIFFHLNPTVAFLCYKLVINENDFFLLPNEKWIVDEKPDVDYSDIGGLDLQKQEIREAVELPLTHFGKLSQKRMDIDLMIILKNFTNWSVSIHHGVCWCMDHQVGHSFRSWLGRSCIHVSYRLWKDDVGQSSCSTHDW